MNAPAPTRFTQESYEARTDFAWTRSGVALLAVAAVFVRHVLVDVFRPADLVAFALLGVGAVGWGIGVVGWNLRHRQAEPSTPRTASELGAVCIGTVALAVSGIVITFVN